MFYTNRRSNAPGLDGVKWVHGTRIGIAESSDGGAQVISNSAFSASSAGYYSQHLQS